MNPAIYFPPMQLVPNESEAPRFGWRLNRSCYAPEIALQAGCASPTWFYVLLGIAAVTGLASKGKA